MSATKRKRFNALEDYSTGIEGSDIFFDEPKIPPPGQMGAQAGSQLERIERLRPSQMIPDRFQPRRLLPTPLRAEFFSGRIDCYLASRKWIELAKEDSGYQAEIDHLLNMGNSFEEHGQIKPITGSWVSLDKGRFVFQIETGERRFWAACLRAVKENMVEEPLLRVEVIQKPTRHRQVVENRHAEPPSSVGQACEIASLILAELKIDPETEGEDEFDYFRQAREQRMPMGVWDRVTPIMQLTRPRMVQLLNIFQLPSYLLELADRYRLPERVLREILALPRERWEQMVRISIQNSLTSDDLALLKNKPEKDENLTPSKISGRPSLGKNALSSLRRFTNMFENLDEFNQVQLLDETADLIVTSGQAESMISLLAELERLVQIRLKRR